MDVKRTPTSVAGELRFSPCIRNQVNSQPGTQQVDTVACPAPYDYVGDTADTLVELVLPWVRNMYTMEQSIVAIKTSPYTNKSSKRLLETFLCVFLQDLSLAEPHPRLSRNAEYDLCGVRSSNNNLNSANLI